MTVDTAVPSALAELADACGVATSYVDAHGAHLHVSAGTLRAVLEAMGVPTSGRGQKSGNDNDDDGDGDGDDDDDPTLSDRRALEEFRLRAWRRVLPPTVVAAEGSACEFSVHVPQGATVSVSAHLETSDVTLPLQPQSPPSDSPSHAVGSREVDGVVVDRVVYTLPASLPIGWHRVVADLRHQDRDQTPPHQQAPQRVESTLLVYPLTIPVPSDLDVRRAVGLATQLYQVRSDASWGMGDLSDLTELADWAGRDLGADFVLVNPMHASEPFPPVSPSPYLPTSRRFSSPLYLRPEQIPEFDHLPAAQKARVAELADSAADLNSRDSIDRDASWALKLEALRIVFDAPLSADRAVAFEHFAAEHGESLRTFALWCAIAGAHGHDSSTWPAEFSGPHSPAVAEYARMHSTEVRFHQWLQWVVSEQRAEAQVRAVTSGMRLGVIHDLAVGVHPTGSDAWALNKSLARGVSVGAPPDIYNQKGQDWSQPPLRPDALAEAGYGPFREIVRAALRDAGGVRIDHILGLFRLWWIPSGSAPTDGTYVYYDHEAMLGVLALEATRAGALVIGEDLGTVAPGVRELLAARGILGTSVMWFEQDDDGPLSPEKYRALCMASVTTHDLPPTAGYADLVHVDIRAELGQLEGDIDSERRGAAREVEGFVSAVRSRGLLTSDSSLDLVAGLHGFTAGSPSLLFAVSVCDLVGDRRPVNMPGTSEEYPNWRVPLSDSSGSMVSLDALRRGDGGPVWRAATGGARMA